MTFVIEMYVRINPGFQELSRKKSFGKKVIVIMEKKMEWGTQVWDKYDDLRNHTSNGTTF